MKWVRPKVHCIARSTVDEFAVREWLDSLGAQEYGRPARVGDAEWLVILAGKRCYNSFVPGINPNVKKVRDDPKEYLDNILSIGHGSVLEHASFTFAIENVSRVFTAEMNRHRAGMAISEQSMRFVRFDNIKLCETPLLRDVDDPSILLIRHQMEQAAIWAESAYVQIMDEVEISEMTKFQEKKIWTSLARRVAPMGVATGGVWTGNIRAWRHLLTMRCSPHAEEEIREVGLMILKDLRERCEYLFGDFTVLGETASPKYVKV